ncbi:hypothetical protein SARC_15774, partial [Sphaeroforma arctica JP610]
MGLGFQIDTSLKRIFQRITRMQNLLLTIQCVQTYTEPYRMRIAEDFDGGDANVLSVKEGEIVWVLLDIDPQWCTVAHDE